MNEIISLPTLSFAVTNGFVFWQVSLAFADLLVIVTVVPEAIMYHVYECWLMGPTGCAIFIYLNFVSINVGSLRYFAPFLQLEFGLFGSVRRQEVRARQISWRETVTWVIQVIVITWLKTGIIINISRKLGLVRPFSSKNLIFLQIALFDITLEWHGSASVLARMHAIAAVTWHVRNYFRHRS